MTSSLTEDYLRWLVPQIGERHREYGDLLALMFEKEFKKVESVPNDENRMVDGLDLRLWFCLEKGLREQFPDKAPTDLIPGPCSFLEVLIGLSKRLAFSAGGDPQGWAWRLVDNLELHRFKDPITKEKAKQVDDILEACIGRTYKPNGQGGFFPLAWADEDQTQVELWYQMSAFIREIPEH